ncbi:hypothetical protein NECAME_18227 [Necator americanus]|uniref:Uncharacterized protein n=1 Tax=Necator americanus TaxID=51031 RepID=W2T8Z3_NECAM|nr:hypothetical protein NECAME_18227 [Necator americanus]ETN78318.1 hypothetical protein NECAME_18227 [Necator americanus]
MKTSYSTPQLQTPTVAEKFLFPKGDEQKMRKYSVEQKSDSGIVKDTLTQKDSWLSVDGYFTPRETIKRKKEIPQPCHDSVSTERLYMDRPRRNGGGGGGGELYRIIRSFFFQKLEVLQNLFTIRFAC